CGISFSIIENPFFIDLLYNLCPNYQPPSREVLSGRLLDQEYSRVTIKREVILNESENLTIALDGWTSPSGNSIYNFIILTPTHNKFLYSLKDFSMDSHTAEFLAEKIDTVLNEIGNDKFAAIVTDNASNVKLAWQIIHKKYPKILNLNCIAHCINLISKDILKHTFASRLIKECNEIIKFFKKSHQPSSYLHQAICELNITG
ncbi:44269_t:CDS:2, partial [Gigaspora margarita]